jgi:hypothetical protein
MSASWFCCWLALIEIESSVASLLRVVLVLVMVVMVADMAVRKKRTTIKRAVGNIHLFGRVSQLE